MNDTIDNASKIKKATQRNRCREFEVDVAMTPNSIASLGSVV
jgi:hypothetical protein